MSPRDAHQTGPQPLSQSFFNSLYHQQQQQQQHQPSTSTATGPSLSRFLSTSIINPIYKSSFFPSTVSENPLFYSTQEGYEHGLADENDDILPDQDDHRLLHADRAARNPRGIEEEEDDDDDPGGPGYSIPHGKQRASDTINSGPLDRLPTLAPLQPDEELEDPFYEHQDLVNSHHHHQALPETRFEPPLPRHLMASHALSNLMASEISYGNHQHLIAQHSDHPSAQNPAGWKMYQSLGPGSMLAPPPSQPRFPPAGPSSPAHHAQPAPPVPPPSQSPSELTERPPARSADPAFAETAETYPLAANEYDDGGLPTVYIYPTEARDIGSDVSGQAALGPQSFRDSFWIGAWLSALLYAFGEAVWVFVGARTELESGKNKLGLVKGLPILAMLVTVTFGISVGSVSLLVLAKRAIRYLVYGAIMGVPSVLGMVGVWTWTSAVTERGRWGMGWRGRLERTVQVLTLAVAVLAGHPSLVIVSVGLSMACILASIPFLTLLLHILLPHHQQPSQPALSSAQAAHALLAAFVWSLRIIVAGVVSHWYFNRHSPPSKHHTRNAYSSLDSTCQSISRALGPSFGTVCLAGFLATLFDSAAKLFRLLNRLAAPSSSSSSLARFGCNPHALLAGWIKIWIGFSHRIFDFIGSFTIIYAGITGFNFAHSFRKTQALVFKQAQLGIFHNLLVKSILNLVALTISLTISLIGYQLYSSSSSAPSSDPSSSDPDRLGLSAGRSDFMGPFVWIFFGLLPFWILRFLTDLISTAVDTLFLCWNIDLDIGTNHSNMTRQARGDLPRQAAMARERPRHCRIAGREIQLASSDPGGRPAGSSRQIQSCACKGAFSCFMSDTIVLVHCLKQVGTVPSTACGSLWKSNAISQTPKQNNAMDKRMQAHKCLSIRFQHHPPVPIVTLLLPR
ncbi:hypothetical protein PTTG_29200 [Puccinia triticina 1-1 BBBD Race 1]|uniref:Choline transporter-like protein n=1 Tax=Puccinia triticina (isolate 1-1 / race 1 (BBBD)) TaxID=630390 RepID=A0A180G5P3_PUCT1|nr:hypothetical protein PTTG_29200 [Puccinia triticina 1-1 BBBD Race 1]